MTIFERIKELADKQGKSLQKVSEDLGLSQNYIYNLKGAKSPAADKLALIADYFHVSVDYLLGRVNSEKENFRKNLKGLYAAQELSGRELAGKLGLSYNDFKSYLIGEKFPQPKNIERMARYFDVSVDYLLGRTNFEQYDGVNKALKEMLNSKEQYFDLVSLLNADNPDSITKNDLKDFTVLNSFIAFSEDYAKIPTDKRWELANGISLLNYSLHNLDVQQSKILGEILQAIHSFLFSINGFTYDDELSDEERKLIDIEKLSQTNTYEDIYKINEHLIEFTKKYKNN
nr:helix-turn-helix transcriptional regulator [Lactococcus lactis]